MKKNCFLLFFLLCACLVQIQDTYRADKNVPYISGSKASACRLERYKLDVYCPENREDPSTIVWFHGGGMEGGSRFVPRELADQGFVAVAVDYRLSPKAKNPAYIEDTAEAVAWTLRNIGEYGGRKDRIFVSGHSAGDYLILILVMDKKHMATYGADADSATAYLPVSGQTVTHFTVHRECGPPNGVPIIDELVSVNKVRRDTAPIVLITGDKNLEMTGRYEENALLVSVLKSIDNRKVSLYELQEFDRGQVFDPACYLIVNYVKKFK